MDSIIDRRRAWALLALVVLLWGVNWPVMKVGLEYIPPLTFAAVRLLLGALTLFVVAAAAGVLRFPARNDWPVVLSVGLVQMALFLGLITVALQFVPAGRSAILAYTTSLWVVPLAAIVLGEPVDRYRGMGMALGLLGVLVLFNPLGFDWDDPAVLLGNGLLLFAAFCWALLIVQVRGYRMEGTPLSLGPWQFLVAAAAVVPIAVWLEHDATIHWSPELAAILIYNGPLATAFCFWGMISVTRALPAATTSIGSLGVPTTGVISAALWLGEMLTATIVSGLLLIGAGLLALALGERAAARRVQ